MSAPFAGPAEGSLDTLLGTPSSRARRPIAPKPESQPIQPLLGRIDLSENSQDPTAGADGLVAEIGASVSIANRLYTFSSGGSNLASLADWSDPANPQLVQQLDLSGFFTTSVAS